MLKKLLLSLLTLCSIGASAQTAMTTTEVSSRLLPSSNSYVSIHDPSVVYDAKNKKYVVVGSHIGVATSTDLINFSSFNTGTEHATFLGQSYEKAFASCPTHEVQVTRNGVTTTETLGSFDAGAFCSTYSTIKVGTREATTAKSWISGDMWAPDIIYNPNLGKWCLYLSLNGDYWASVIILMTSDSPTGPFTYEAPIVFGGFNGRSYSGKTVSITKTDLPLVTGSTSTPSRYTSAGTSWGTYYPNCIDPCVFFDEEGELWMIYGSWSGGIWGLKLDKNTGLRDYTYTYSGTTLSATSDDQYFGKRIAGGNYVSGEGPYVQHIGDYYYLFVSYGGYAPDGGYEMRVFRSDSPMGPYKDDAGYSALYTSRVTNFGPKTSGGNRGQKIIGSMNDWGNMKVGECAQGHNSVCLDPDGNAYVMFHTKFNDGTAGHQIRVHRLFINERGWLVAAPFRYLGTNAKTGNVSTTQKEIEASQLFTPQEIEGTYQIIRHPYGLDYSNYAESTPVEVHLSADGKVSGSYTGTWKYSQDGKSFVTLTLAGVLYYGVIEKQQVNGQYMDAICFTAVSKGGVPVWLYKYDDKSAIAKNYNSIYTGFISKIGSSTPATTSIPATTDDVKAAYTADPDDVMSEYGVLTAPAEKTKLSIAYNFSRGDFYISGSSSRRYAAAATDGVDITSDMVAHYKLTTTISVNDCNTDQKLAVTRAGSGTAPTIFKDGSRDSVLHVFYGAQANSSYGKMPNPLNGTDADAFTVSFWVKTENLSQWDNIFSFTNASVPAGAGGRFYFCDNTYCGYNDAAGTYFDINYPGTATYKDLTQLTWKFVTITMSSTGYTLYLDGVAQAQKTFAGTTTVDAFDYAAAIKNIRDYANMCIGMGSYWGSSHFLMSDLSVYKRALTADDVKALYGKSLNPAYNVTFQAIEEFAKADVNHDGNVDINDVNAVISVICGDATYADTADVNGSGTVDINDVNAVIDVICGN